MKDNRVIFTCPRCGYYRCQWCGGYFAREKNPEMTCQGHPQPSCCHYGDHQLFAGRWTLVMTHGPNGASRVEPGELAATSPYLRVVE